MNKQSGRRRLNERKEKKTRKNKPSNSDISNSKTFLFICIFPFQALSPSLFRTHFPSVVSLASSSARISAFTTHEAASEAASEAILESRWEPDLIVAIASIHENSCVSFWCCQWSLSVLLLLLILSTLSSETAAVVIRHGFPLDRECDAALLALLRRDLLRLRKFRGQVLPWQIRFSRKFLCFRSEFLVACRIRFL